MPVFVTGASGFLGGRLAQLLHARGQEVVVLARPTSNLRHLSGIPVRVVRGDLSNRATLTDAVKDVTHIYHCAACSTDWATSEAYVAANVTGTENVVAAAQLAPKLERLLHVSTTDIYGYPAVPCTELQPFLDAGLPYNQTKGRGEAAVWSASRDCGLPVTIVRPATIYGPRGKDFTLEIATLLRLRMMVTIDGGSAPGGFTYVDNVAEAILAAASSGRTVGEAYNLSDGTNATWQEYLMRFAAHLRVSPPWLNLSFDAAMRMARVVEVPHRLFGLGGRPLLTQHAVYLLGRNQEFPNAKAVSDFGFSPAVSLEEGLERSSAWVGDKRKGASMPTT